MQVKVKAVSALAFVVVLAGVLTIPLRGSDDSSVPDVSSPRVELSPSVRRAETIGSARNIQGRVPDECRRWWLGSPSDGGTIAASRAGRVTLVTPDGEVVARLKETGPVGWSVSGRFLATGSDGALWNSDGSPVQRHEYQVSLGQPGSTWAWSPAGDCGFVLDRHGRLGITVVNPSKIPPTWGVNLVEGVEAFALSSDWRWLGLVLDDPGSRSIAIADLRRRRINIVKTYARTTCCITLAGWGGAGRNLYFWAGPGNSVMADGWPLQAISVPAGPVQRVRATVIPDPFLMGECAGRSAVIAGGNRDRRTNKRIRYIEGGNVALTPRHLAVSSFSCSPGSTLVFSAADDGDDPVARKLYLIERAGSGGLKVLADDPDAADDRPEWSPGTGVLFVRWSGSEGELWLLPEGGVPRRLPLSVKSDPGAYWSGGNWDRVIDWSATRPRGLPRG